MRNLATRKFNPFTYVMNRMCDSYLSLKHVNRINPKMKSTNVKKDVIVLKMRKCNEGVLKYYKSQGVFERVLKYVQVNEKGNKEWLVYIKGFNPDHECVTRFDSMKRMERRMFQLYDNTFKCSEDFKREQREQYGKGMDQKQFEEYQKDKYRSDDMTLGKHKQIEYLASEDKSTYGFYLGVLKEHCGLSDEQLDELVNEHLYKQQRLSGSMKSYYLNEFDMDDTRYIAL